ncbi:MAG: EamA family transporter [Gemmatimonadetes bacterium]|nr:EamA family transporter [Gemmatimonadota bacterium]
MTSKLSERSKLIAAFAAVYLIWGSTYLAIRFAIETIPPFLMAGTRFLMAGSILFLFAKTRGTPRPQLIHWRTALVVGVFLLLGGNGLVAWSEQVVPSGQAALLVTTEPLWVMIIAYTMGRERLSGTVVIGLVMGFAGVLLLVGPETIAGGERVSRIGALALTVAALSWAIGSLYSSRAPQPSSQSLASAMTMLAGGALLILAGAATGEFARFDFGAVTLRSTIALAYLSIFGSVVAFSAYLWLMRNVTPSRASTYAYVNPVIAVLVGWGFGGEGLTLRTVLAAVIIVGSVSLIISKQSAVNERKPAPKIKGRDSSESRLSKAA